MNIKKIYVFNNIKSIEKNRHKKENKKVKNKLTLTKR